VAGHAGRGEEAPEDPRDIGRGDPGQVEHEDQTGDGQDDAEEGETVRGAARAEPHVEHDQDGAEVFEQQGDPDIEVLDGAEVAELGRGDAEEAVETDERQMPKQLAPPSAQHRQGPGQEQEGSPTDADGDDRPRRPAGLDERLAEGPRRREEQAGHDHREEATPDVPADRLDHHPFSVLDHGPIRTEVSCWS
jgi:hypothetical protein